MIKVIVLDTTPLGLMTQRSGRPEADACQQWAQNWETQGIRVLVPEIADYEVRRELIRAGLTASVTRLDRFNAAEPYRYLTLTTAAIRHAAEPWADARNAGVATADKFALDGDVILCAQALALHLLPEEIIVATSNVKHIGRYLAAEEWQKIVP